MTDTYKQIEAAVETINQRTAGNVASKPLVLIICGSGLGGIADILQGPTVRIPYGEIPGFVVSTVSGHDGALLFGTIGTNQVPVVCMVGRLHFYEGWDFNQATFPIRVAAALGVKYMVATNAAGGINAEYKPGELMVINDHINLPGLGGNHPLRGPNLDKFGPRFLAMSDAYDFEMRIHFFDTARDLNITRHIHEGVYTYVSGPSFETRAECRMIRAWGGDTVGMSTVPEIIVGRHCGLRCFGLSLVTNAVVYRKPHFAKSASALGLTAEQVLGQVHDEAWGKASHEEVLAEGKAASEDVTILIEGFVNRLT